MGIITVGYDMDCDFCGVVKPYLAHTSRGSLCSDCLKIYQVEIKEAINLLTHERRKKRNIYAKDINISRNIANEALLKMAGGTFDATGKKISID